MKKQTALFEIKGKRMTEAHQALIEHWEKGEKLNLNPQKKGKKSEHETYKPKSHKSLPLFSKGEETQGTLF